MEEGFVKVETKNLQGIGGIAHLSVAEPTERAEQLVFERDSAENEFRHDFDRPHNQDVRFLKTSVSIRLSLSSTVPSSSICCRIYQFKKF